MAWFYLSRAIVKTETYTCVGPEPHPTLVGLSLHYSRKESKSRYIPGPSTLQRMVCALEEIWPVVFDNFSSILTRLAGRGRRHLPQCARESLYRTFGYQNSKNLILSLSGSTKNHQR